MNENSFVTMKLDNVNAVTYRCELFNDSCSHPFLVWEFIDSVGQQCSASVITTVSAIGLFISHSKPSDLDYEPVC